MALLGLIAAYNEERLLDAAVRSALAGGVDEVHVFDGAWRAAGASGPAFAGARRAASTDATAEVARAAGAIFHPRRGIWAHQGMKRTAMFHQCGAREGDQLFVLDADERMVGHFPPTLAAGVLNVLLRSVGPNDLPGVRAHFPRGDYSEAARPALRVFAWTPDLTCVQPGHYLTGGRRIDPYNGMRSRLPLIESVCIEHYANLRDGSRLEAKRAYYEVDHPARRTRLAALPPPSFRPRRQRMAQKRIADRRIYGTDYRGRTVLVAAPGQPIPAGFEVDEEAPKPKRRSTKAKSK